MVVAQLVERSLPIPEVRGSNQSLLVQPWIVNVVSNKDKSNKYLSNIVRELALGWGTGTVDVL